MSDAAVGAPEQPGDRGRRASSTSWPCWPTWSSGARCAPCRCRPRAADGRPCPAGRGSTGPSEPAVDGPSTAEPPDAPDEAKRYRVDDVRPARRCCSRSSPARAHFVGLVGRGMAADPNRVPWGNMYEFTITGAFVVVARLPAAAQALRPGLDGPDRHRHRGRPADGRGALALRPGRAADRGAAVVLAGDPRGVGDHRHRRVHPRRHHLGALPGQGALAGARHGAPTAATSPGCPRCRRSTGSPTGSTPSASRSGPSRC